MNDRLDAYRGQGCYFGDIHNHCNVSYGHGALSDAFANAKLQLDFASVTGHSSWPDIPAREGIMSSVVDYHVSGFDRLESLWEYFLRTTEENNRSGEFVTFMSYEVHSMKDGDYTAIFFEPGGRMHRPTDIGSFQKWIASENESGRKCLILPHHIAYKTGYRGINWDTFREDASPLVEIVSMHGCSESDDAPFPYLHTMGPRDGRNTMQAGLERGYHFGVTGSTDHHSAHPGSYGFGKTGVWADSLTREGLWEAFRNRRTFAVSGDRMILQFAVDGSPMGSRIESAGPRRIEFAVKGGYALDSIEVIKNNRVLRRRDIASHRTALRKPMRGKTLFEVGWGEKSVEQDWDVSLVVKNGALLDIEPRFHGVDIVDPKDRTDKGYHFTSFVKGAAGADFKTKTWGNPTATSHAAQGLSLEIEGDRFTEIQARVNGRMFSWSLGELAGGTATEHLGGFLTGAICVHRFVPEKEYIYSAEFIDSHPGNAASDFYYLRVAQKNGHWGWSSPIRIL